MSKLLVEEEEVTTESPALAETCLAKIGKVAGFRKGLRRRVAFLWEDGDAAFYRVNYHDEGRENRIASSLFVRVTPGGAEVLQGIHRPQRSVAGSEPEAV
jgi:hypothetical protein